MESNQKLVLEDILEGVEKRGEKYQDKEFFSGLSDKAKKEYEKLYLKYEGNEFKIKKVLNLKSKVDLISSIAGLCFVALLFFGGAGLGIIALLLLFIASVSKVYFFFYKHTGCSVIISAILAIVTGALVTILIGSMM